MELTVQIIVGLGGFGGLAALLLVLPQIKKLRADEHRVHVDAAIAEDAQKDDHWEAVFAAQMKMVDTQVTAIVTPLLVEVGELRDEVRGLREQVALVARRYRLALETIRSLYRWIAVHMADVTEAPPAVPNEIADDI